MSEILNQIGEAFTNYVTIANIMAVLTFLTVVVKFITSVKKNKNTTDFSKEFKSLKEENAKLEEDNNKLAKELTKIGKAFLVMVRYSRLSEVAIGKIEDLIDNDLENVDISAPVVEKIPVETSQTIVEKLENELKEGE